MYLPIFRQVTAIRIVTQRTHLSLLDCDGTSLRVRLLREDRGVYFGRRLIMVDSALRKFFLLLYRKRKNR